MGDGSAHFLARGYDVVAWDRPRTARNGRDTWSTPPGRRWSSSAWPTVRAATGWSWSPTSPRPSRDADVVQESAPEQLDLKVKLLADIDAVAPPHVVISSSTSGYGMSEMQVDCVHPERTVVAHPFNPPYLVPLVEVVGGVKTSPDVVAWTSEFFRHAGKSVITMEREVPGFVANRLQEALWREALHMVAAGEATVEQIDLSITDGPGLRWPVQGPCLTFHLAGGQGGMGHMLDHFGPSLQSPWTRLVSTELTPQLRDEMVAGCDREAAGRSIDDLVAERDRA